MRSLQHFVEDTFTSDGPAYASFKRSVIVLGIGVPATTLTEDVIGKLTERANQALTVPNETYSSTIFIGCDSLTMDVASDRARTLNLGEPTISELGAGEWIELPPAAGEDVPAHRVRVIDAPFDSEVIVALRVTGAVARS